MIVIDIFGILEFIGFLCFAFTIIVVAGVLFDFLMKPFKILMKPFKKIRYAFFNSDKCVERIMKKLSLDDEIETINKTLKSVRK